MIVLLRQRARPEVGFHAGLRIERAQRAAAIGIANVAKIKNSVVKKRPRIVIPGPPAVGGKRGEIRLAEQRVRSNKQGE